MKPYPLLTIFSVTLLLTACSTPPANPSATTAPSATRPTPPAPTKPGAPSAASAPASKPATPTLDDSDSAAVPSALPATALPPPKLTPEAEAVVRRLTYTGGDNTVHELADTTGFPSALDSLQPGVRSPKTETPRNPALPPPKGLTADGNSTELVERDWTGLVLVPVNAALAKAYTSEVRLLRVEAHPLHDGRLRIWARFRNLSRRTLPAEIACSFRMRGETTANSPYFYEIEVPAGADRDVFFVSPDGELSAYTVLVRSEEMWKQP